jgi:hypothetical protein
MKRIKDVVIMFDVEVVRTNLSTCLRESTQMWYTKDLNHLKKKALRTLENDADHWCYVLLKKFKKFVVSTLNYLIIERYILNDVRANKNISSFVFSSHEIDESSEHNRFARSINLNLQCHNVWVNQEHRFLWWKHFDHDVFQKSRNEKKHLISHLYS